MAEITKPILLDETGNRIADRLTMIADAIAKGQHGKIYGFHIDGTTFKVTYLKDAVGMIPAYMDYATGKFNYGSWEDAFFMPRLCMVKYDGTVDYYLDPDDYTKKEDGTASDVANTAYNGNAMVEWGRNGKKIWMKIEADEGDTTSGSVYIADYQVDSTYQAYNFINNQGLLVDHFYTRIYKGSLVDGKMRSLSGQALMKGLTASQEIAYATANNLTSDVLWYTTTYADVMLINNLLILMSKSLDTQTAFGNGFYSGGSEATMHGTGLGDDKGMFWGANNTNSVVKVFGMEDWWGNQWERYAGHMLVDGVEKVKMTYGMQDGSASEGYNTTGNGYIPCGATPSGTSGELINSMTFTPFGMFPTVMGGSAYNIKYHDACWYNNSGQRYAYRGGACANSLSVGAFCLDVGGAASSASWAVGSALSLKPLV